MAKLSYIEKKAFEILLRMEAGYVLDFNDRTFSEFFNSTAKININSPKYSTNGTSKAKRLRVFWDIESDAIVGKILFEMLLLATYESKKILETDKDYLICRNAAEKLLGNLVNTTSSEEKFLKTDFCKIDKISLQKLGLEHHLIEVLDNRIKEIEKCLKASCWLSSVIMIGSVAEGILLGVAGNFPKMFNESKSSPKRDGAPKKHTDWTLKDFIDVAYDIKLLHSDVQKFSHALRDFRNYIHPYSQIGKHNIDKYTAEICLKVLEAMIASLINHR